MTKRTTLLEFARVYIEDRIATLQREGAHRQELIARIQAECAEILAEAEAAAAEQHPAPPAPPAEVIPAHVRTTRAGDVLP